MRAKRKKILLTLVVLVFLSPLLLLAHPRARAALRIAPGFVALEEDPRVFLEPGADSLARLMAEALPEAITDIEEAHSLPFPPGFRIYVCASHESFTRHMGHPPDSPVRGNAFPRDVWISPLCLDFRGRDTHRETLTHELAHLYLNRRLGWWRRTRLVPGWFAEGLADWVAGTGKDVISRSEAVEAIRNGRYFDPEPRGRWMIATSPRGYGVSYPMLHRQVGLFFDYLLSLDEAAFQNLVIEVTRGNDLASSFTATFGRDLEDLWAGFLADLDAGSPATSP